MCYRSLLLRRDLRFRPCNCCSPWRRTDPCNGRTGRFLRTILHSTDGNLKLHRHCHPAKYRLRCICLHHRHIHRRYVHGRYRTRSSYGRGTDNRSNAGSKETQYQTIQGKSLRQRTLGRFQRCFLGIPDAGHHSGRYLRRYLHTNRSSSRIRCIRTLRRYGHLPRSFLPRYV